MVSIVARLIGSGAMVVVAAVMVILDIGAEEASWTLILVAGEAPFVIAVEEITCVSGGVLGGLIGSHFLRKRFTSG